MRIAVYGDSMTEYLHQPPRALAEHLARLQPPVDAQLFNYGVGAKSSNIRGRTGTGVWLAVSEDQC